MKFKKDHTFQFLSVLMETIFLVKDHLVLKGAQFTTVPNMILERHPQKIMHKIL